MDRNDVGVVFSGAWLIHVFTCEALCLDSHVELGFLHGLFEVTLNLVLAWSRSHSTADHSVTGRSADGHTLDVVCLFVVGINRIVTLRSNWFGSLVNLLCALGLGLYHFEAGDVVRRINIIGVRSREAVGLLSLCAGAFEDALSLVHDLTHAIVDVILARSDAATILEHIEVFNCTREGEAMACFSKLNWPVLVGSWSIIVLQLTSCC